jgi:DNA polymerase-3 subunit delta
MQITAQQLFKDLDAGKATPLCLVVGDEPFQSGEIVSRLKSHFIKDETSAQFNYESWDGEHLDVGGLIASLDTLPGLFGGDSLRLVVCRNFEKIPAASLETLESYLKRPSDTTCFLILAAKADKRKAWYKAVDEHGAIIEVNEPYDREWPKWQGYFERRAGKKIDAEAWEMLVLSSGRSLSLLWAELLKAATYVGEATRITARDVQSLNTSPQGADIFSLAENVLNYQSAAAMREFYDLTRNGESEIKILSILVRQFRLVEGYLKLARKGITESKVVGPQIGVSPYFVPKIAAQSKKHSLPKLQGEIIPLLAEADYRLKTGDGGVFENFLVSYFSNR